MNQSENIADLAAALAKAQGEINPAIKETSNSFLKTKYASLPAVWEACREPLSKNGLAVTQTFDEKNGKMILVTTLAHESGQWIKSFCPMVCVKEDPQGYGSAITYFRRYCLAAMIGIVQDDDDGHDSSHSELRKKLFDAFFKCSVDVQKHILDELKKNKIITGDINTVPPKQYNSVINYINKFHTQKEENAK